MLSFFTLSDQGNAETSEMDVEASMRVEKSLCGSAAVFPESKKAGQSAAFFCTHPSQYTFIFKDNTFFLQSKFPDCSETYVGWQVTSSLFQVFN